MERSHRQLCSRLAYRLRRDDSNSFANVHFAACSHIGAVALRAYSVLASASQHSAYVYLGNARFFYRSSHIVRNHFILRNQ